MPGRGWHAVARSRPCTSTTARAIVSPPASSAWLRLSRARMFGPSTAATTGRPGGAQWKQLPRRGTARGSALAPGRRSRPGQCNEPRRYPASRGRRAGGRRRCRRRRCGCMLAAAAMLVARPAAWPWAIGGDRRQPRAADRGRHCGRAARWLGPNWVRLPATAARARREMALTIDDGPDPEVTPAVLDILDGHGARATFLLHRRARRRASGAGARHRRARPRHREPQPAPPASLRAARPGRHARARSARAAARSATSPVRRRASSARRRACAIRSSIRCSRSSACGWPAGRGAASTPRSARCRRASPRGCCAGSPPATSCCCTMAMRRARRRAARWCRGAAAVARSRCARRLSRRSRCASAVIRDRAVAAASARASARRAYRRARPVRLAFRARQARAAIRCSARCWSAGWCPTARASWTWAAARACWRPGWPLHAAVMRDGSGRRLAARRRGLADYRGIDAHGARNRACPRRARATRARFDAGDMRKPAIRRGRWWW